VVWVRNEASLPFTWGAFYIVDLDITFIVTRYEGVVLTFLDIGD